MFSAEDEDCLSLETLRAYEAGQLDSTQRHKVERHLLDCELCTLTLEGVADLPDETIQEGQQAIAAAAWARVEEKKKRRGAWVWVSAAASIVLLISFAWIFLSGPSEETMQQTFSEMIKDLPADKEPFATNRTPDPQGNNQASEASPSIEVPLAELQLEESDAVIMEEPAEYEHSSRANTYNWSVQSQEAIPPSPNAAPVLTQPYFSPSDKGEVTISEERKFKDQSGIEAEEESMADDAGITLSEIQVTTSSASPRLEKTTAKKSVELDAVKITKAPSVQGPGRYKNEEDRYRRADKAKQAAPQKEAKAAPKADNMALGKSADIQANKKEGLADTKTFSRDQDHPKEVEETNLDFNSAGFFHLADSVSIAQRANESQQPAYDQAMDAFRAKDYANAATLFRQATAETPANLQAHLYAANSFLNIGQPQAAIFHLDRILNQPDNAYTEDATWYKALAYLKLNDSAPAKTLLKSIEKAGGKHAAEATTTLQKLK